MRTEPPTRRRLDEARRDGRVARSGDLTAAVLALGAVAVLVVAAPVLLDDLKQMTADLLGSAGHMRTEAGGGVWQAVAPAAGTLGLMCAALVVLAVAAGVVQVGFLASAKPLRPDLGRLWHAERLLSKRSAVRLAMTVAKVAAVACVAVLTIRAELPRIVASAKGPAGELAARAGGAVVGLALRVGLVLLALAGVDWLYQRWQHGQDLMMTRRELEDELRQTQGDADVRRRRRELQTALTVDGQAHTDRGDNDE